MKKQNHFKPQGIFRVLFNYLYYTNQSHLEKSFINKLNERPQDEKTEYLLKLIKIRSNRRLTKDDLLN